MEENKNSMPKRLYRSILKLEQWLRTWLDVDGGFHGFVVHFGHLKRMFRIHDDAFAQAPIILGYLNIYKRTLDNFWLHMALMAADNLLRRFDYSTGEYQYAGFESHISKSLIACAYADIALLDVAKIIMRKNPNKARMYIKTARKNIDLYLIDKLWNPDEGAFTQSKFDVYSLRRRHIANMNSVAAEALIKLSELINDDTYIYSYAIPAGEFVIKSQILSEDRRFGGIRYSDTHPQKIPTLYTAYAMMGLDDLFLKVQERKFLTALENAAKFLISHIDPHTNLFFRGYIGRDLYPYPQLIAGAGIIIKMLKRVEELCDGKYLPIKTLDTILSWQYINGAFPNSVGYAYMNRKELVKDIKIVWEDAVPVVGWNGYLYEALTSILPKGIKFYSRPIVRPDLEIDGDNFIYKERMNSAIIYHKLNFFGFKLKIPKYYCNKKSEYGIGVFPRKWYKDLRMRYLLIKKKIKLLSCKNR